MDFDDTPEEAAFRAEAREWLGANAIPKGHPEDFSAGIWSEAYGEETYLARCQAWQARLAEAGWAALTWPVLYGGRGLRPIHQAIFNQEQAAFGVSVGAFAISIGMVGPTLLVHGSEEQRQRFLPPMLRGEEIWCQLFSEPGAGSDLAAVTTRAERTAEGWVVSGQKVWTSLASRARWGILLARTDPTVPKHRGITYLLVDMADPGIEIRPLRQMTGEAHFSEVFLDGVGVPGEHVVGEVGGGWAVAQTTLASERGTIAAGSAGADPAGLIALARRFGRQDDPVVRRRLTEVHIRSELLRFLRYRSLTALSQGRRPGAETSMMKLAYARFMTEMTRAALDLQGPAATLAGDDLPAGSWVWQRKFLHSPSLHIAGGSDQVQANILGERVLGLPAEDRADRDVAFRDLLRAGR